MRIIKGLGLAALFIAGFVFSTPSQDQSSAVSGGTLYYRALAACLDKEAITYGGQRAGIDYQNRIVQENVDLLTSVPSTVGSIKVEYLDHTDVIERYKKLRKDIPVLALRPIQSNGDTLLIPLTDFLVTYRKNKLNYALEGGCQVQFRYDCEKKWYALTKVELWGV